MTRQKGSESNLFDITIIGSGGAGLCLIWAFIKTGLIHHISLLVIEPKMKNTNDRTWCFWAEKDDSMVKDLGQLLKHQWKYIEFQKKQNHIHPYQYYHLESLDFYNHLFGMIKQYPQIHYQNDEVLHVLPKGNSYTVATKHEKFYTSDYVFDSRFDTSQQKLFFNENQLKQSFFGYKVTFDQPILDDALIHMMNFDYDQDGFCQFVYVLPFSNNCALIELTRFGTKILNQDTNQKKFFEWIYQKYGKFTIVESEKGVIPMDLSFNKKIKFYPKNVKHIPIGTAAGAVKATTGYAFRDMYRHSMVIAQAILNKKPIPAIYRPSRLAFYDSLLIDILVQNPHYGKQIFTQLFQRVKHNVILKFLDEKTSFLEEIPILWALPKSIFLRKLWSKFF